LEAIILINNQNSVVARTIVNGVVFVVRQNGGHIVAYTCPVDVQNIKMLTLCSYFTVVGVLFFYCIAN